MKLKLNKDLNLVSCVLVTECMLFKVNYESIILLLLSSAANLSMISSNGSSLPVLFQLRGQPNQVIIVQTWWNVNSFLCA